MPKEIIIGRTADGTAITTTVLTGAEYFFGGGERYAKVHGEVDIAPTDVLEERYEELDEFFEGTADVHERVLCGHEGDCWFNSREQIEDELARRGVA